MDLSTAVVAVIIALDFYFLEFLFQELEVTFEELLKVGFDA